jgi:hypothetical protein
MMIVVPGVQFDATCTVVRSPPSPGSPILPVLRLIWALNCLSGFWAIFKASNLGHIIGICVPPPLCSWPRCADGTPSSERNFDDAYLFVNSIAVHF